MVLFVEEAPFKLGLQGFQRTLCHCPRAAENTAFEPGHNCATLKLDFGQKDTFVGNGKKEKEKKN